MGQASQKVKEVMFGSKKINIFMLGNSDSGKTTMLYKWKDGITIQAQPTVGFNFEDVQYNDATFKVMDVGGRDKLRTFYHHYMANQHGIVVVVDASNFVEQNLLQSTLQLCIMDIYKNKKMPLLILANKSDKCSHSDQEILNFVGVGIFHDKIYYQLIHTNCFSGEGLNEALEWLYKQHTK